MKRQSWDFRGYCHKLSFKKKSYYTFWTMLNSEYFWRNYFFKNFEIFRTSEKKIGQLFLNFKKSYYYNHTIIIVRFIWLLTLLAIINTLIVNIPDDCDIIFHRNIKNNLWFNENLRNPGGIVINWVSPRALKGLLLTPKRISMVF